MHKKKKMAKVVIKSATIRDMPDTVSRLLSPGSYLPSPVPHLLWLYHVSCLTSSGSRLLSNVSCLMTPVSRLHAVSAADLIDR